MEHFHVLSGLAVQNDTIHEDLMGSATYMQNFLPAMTDLNSMPCM